jgi:hypothetical protein
LEWALGACLNTSLPSSSRHGSVSLPWTLTVPTP